MELYCPDCQCILENYNNIKLICYSCKSQVQLKNGIPDFTKGRYYYPQDKGRERMQSILNDIKEKPWAEIEETLFSETPSLRNKIFNIGRSDWRFLPEINKDSIILDFGCGYGTMSDPLSYMAKKVYAVDATFEQIEFTTMRMEKQGIKNAFCLCADIKTLPFPDKIFDVIVMVGVLEWLATGNTQGQPEEMQLEALRILCRKLKTDGQLIFGIENRMSYKYFLGKREEHVAVRLVALLPRCIADLYVRLRKGIPYRTYTYTKMGYDALLKKAGFIRSSYFVPLPFYHNPDHILPLCRNNQGSFNSCFENLNFGTETKKILTRLGIIRLFNKLLPYFTSSFFVIANKGDRKKSWERKYIDILHDEIIDFYKMPTRVSKESSVAFSLFNDKQKTPAYLLKVSRATDNNHLMKKEAETILKLQMILDKEMQSKIPELIKYNDTPPLNELIYRAFSGKKLLRKVIKQKERLTEKCFHSTYEKIFAFILDFHLQSTSNTVIVDKLMIDGFINNDFNPFVEKLHLDTSEKQMYFQYLEDFKTMVNCSLPLTMIHGDLCLDNILWENNDFIVIDWKLSGNDTFPFYDIYNLIFSILALDQQSNKNYLLKAFNYHLYDSSSDLSRMLIRVLNKYAEKLKIPVEIFRLFYLDFLVKANYSDAKVGINREDIWKGLLLLHIEKRDKFFV